MQLFVLPWLSGWQWCLLSIILALITFCVIIAMWESDGQLQINQQWNTNKEKKKHEYTPPNSEAIEKGGNVATLWIGNPLPDPVPFPVVMPNRYVIDSKFNMSQAREKFAETQKWRKDQGIDNLIFKKRPFYHVVRSAYPHFLNGRSKQVQTSIIYSICTC